MNTIISKIDINNIDKNELKKQAELLKEGKTVIFPTETVYGLGANALNENSVKKIFVAKGRPQDNPLIVHVSSKDVSGLVKKVPEVAEKLINKFWPGPLTIILEKKDIIPNVTSANLNTIGIRMPNSEIALKLIELSEKPIAAPSANISGRPSPTEVERCVEDLNGRVEYIIGGESSDIGVESTIIDCTVNPPMILRPGGITLEMLREIDSNIDIDEALKSKPNENLKPKAPGMKYRHYAEKNNDVAILTTDENLDKFDKGNVISLGSEKDLSQIAKHLFEALRKCDDMGVKYILCQGFEEKGVGVAIMNRLTKAAGYDIVDV